MFSKIATMKSINGYWDNIEKVKLKIQSADAILIGAGARLSASAGFTYSGKRFEHGMTVVGNTKKKYPLNISQKKSFTF